MENFEGIRPVTNLTQTPQVVEMDSILQRVRPIEGTFNPNEEVQKLLSVPKEQRREAVSVFRDKLTRQRKAWALCRTTIEERIEANPDIPREEMVGIIGQFASNYGFAKPHTKIAEQLIDDYISQHKKVVEIRKKYPDDIALINRLTGMKFTGADAGDFTVRVGPMSLEIFCSGLNTARIYEKSNDPVTEDEYPGFASQSDDRKPIYYLVVNNDATWKIPDGYAAILVLHEREHQKNRILEPRLYGRSKVRADVREMLNRGVLGFLRHQVGERLFDFERPFEYEVLGRYASTKAPDEKAFLLGEFMRLRREYALNTAKNEIIAFIAMKVRPFLLRDMHTIFSEQGYDYLAYLRDWYDEKKAHPLWQEISRRVLVDEYRDIIDKAFTASDSLGIHGYSPEETIAILSDKRLQDWPKTVRRLLEAEKPQN